MTVTIHTGFLTHRISDYDLNAPFVSETQTHTETPYFYVMTKILLLKQYFVLFFMHFIKSIIDEMLFLKITLASETFP